MVFLFGVSLVASSGLSLVSLFETSVSVFEMSLVSSFRLLCLSSFGMPLASVFVTVVDINSVAAAVNEFTTFNNFLEGKARVNLLRRTTVRTLCTVVVSRL